MISSLWVLTCDGCGRMAFCEAPEIWSLSDKMGRQGWAIRAVDPTCIPEVACPDCAEAEL